VDLDIIAEQIRYYRARAGEYDASSQPEGEFLAAAITEAHADLQALGPIALAIELGAGTGQFTNDLALIAQRVVAVDASPEMLELNQAKVPAPNVERVAADVFEWEPRIKADLVMFGFLLSHIPMSRFDAFWNAVGEMLGPARQVFVIDECRHDLWQEEPGSDATSEVVRRTLVDGRAFHIVKVLWDPVLLSSRLERLGWRSHFLRRDPFFWGTVERASRSGAASAPRFAA
jgi:SAM-dependent methyltransferase